MERGGVKNGKKNFQRAGDQDHAKERINCRMMEEADVDQTSSIWIDGVCYQLVSR